MCLTVNIRDVTRRICRIVPDALSWRPLIPQLDSNLMTMLTVDRSESRIWMRWVLIVAAIYNLGWGLFIVLLPELPFRLAGMQIPNYLSLVQCIGMIVGVYGVGYAIAADDPVRHWPIVLVGLLGKICGPIGFVWAATRGELPWIAGLTIVTNDLIWWLPFGLILLTVARNETPSTKLQSAPCI